MTNKFITNTLPPKKDVMKDIIFKEVNIWERIDKQLWTNCSSSFFNYIKNGKNIKFFVKKSFLKWNYKNFESDYKILKEKFKNIIPNQAFIQLNWDIFAFCAPIWIKIDILDLSNKNYVLDLLKINPKLIKQIKYFIKKTEELYKENKYIDLSWKENLIISDSDKLYYIDSFLVFMDRKYFKEQSIEKLNYLKQLIKELTKLNNLPLQN